MKKLAVCLVIIIGLHIFISHGYAQDAEKKSPEVSDLSREKKMFRNYSGQGSNSVSSFCIEGQVFVMVSGDTSNAPSITQVFEERNGKVVPKRCQ
jgi:hypothetical protein